MSEDYAGLVTRLREMAAHGGAPSRRATMRAAADALEALAKELGEARRNILDLIKQRNKAESALAAMATERDEMLAAHRQRDIVDLALEQQHTQAEAALALAQTERKQARALLVRCPEAVRLALSYIESRLDDSYWNRMVALDADLRAALGEGRP